MKLTIAIPTFNRNATLKESLQSLLPQLTPECQLLILDDHSDVPVAETLRTTLASFPPQQVKIIRHRWNIGLVANVLRCFELCETDWIWIPGDDDIVTPDAVATVLSQMANARDAIYLSFLTEAQRQAGTRPAPWRAQGRTSFIKEVDMVHQINFMSCSVWRTEPFRQHLRDAYYHSYAGGWSFALLLTALRDTDAVVFSNEALVLKSSIAPVALRRSYRRQMLGWPTLLEISLTSEERRILSRKMLALFSPENVTAYILADQAKHDWPDKYLYYDLAKGRIGPYKVHPFALLRFALYRLLFIHPKSGWKVVRCLINAANRLGLKSIDLSDLEGRS
jgi:glycosyltransferase involved in cell wall biosynthesis